MISTNKLFEYLSNIPDPEIPVINIVEMGIVRDVEFIENELVVKITPTYSGCPAMKSIEQEIIAELKLKGFDKVLVKTLILRHGQQTC